ncbi:nickel-dependent lactate racemase [Alkalicella caledoniensis]|uniref:Nickel-dependent lactate racemase n=1 Tax=Alkalicella caledoniensis TaxID=2731377 RepID=A0A7G9WA18_ALKCA|nr:nickel-dependent lactate racemase [Alkalicella caledoniensis]QNO15530.1 nickel-dependent lactate racemase [Alkalicella caledoniensis]
MDKYKFKYGRKDIDIVLPSKSIIQTLKPKNSTNINDIEGELIRVLENPVGSKPLKDIVKSGEKVVIVISDITRAWIKNHLFLIHIVNYLNDLGINDNSIKIIVALGTHRPSTLQEVQILVGEELYSRVKVFDHNCFDDNNLMYMGESSFGTPIYINKRVAEADRVILTGGIVFHLFAGFGGGAKSLVPGVAGLKTIQHNHRLTFYEGEGAGLNPNAGSNKISDNPMREDITEICRKFSPDFLFNVVLDTEGNFVKFVGGDFEKAWLKGCDYIRELYGIEIREKAEIIVASAGGYPKDMNLYQSVKTMDNCLYGGNEDSVIVLFSECSEGLGAEEFLSWFRYSTLEDMEKALKENFTVPGYAAYKTAYTGVFRKLILVSALPDETVKKLGFIPAGSPEEAMNVAYSLAPSNPKITLMPYGGNTLPIVFK